MSILFELDNDSEAKVYNFFEKTKAEVDDNITHIKEWLQTQLHLPEIMDENKIRNFLILNKFNIEKTKEKIDMYYTIRSKVPDFFADNNPNCPRMMRANKESMWGVLPQQKDGLYRVHFFKVLKPGGLHIYETAIQFFNIIELRLNEDYLTGDIIVVDSGSVTFWDYLKVSPLFLLKGLKVYQSVYSLRLRNLYCLNAPPALSVVLSIMKKILKPKIFSRISLCKDESCLKQFLNDQQIPQDYGGEGPSLKELNHQLLIKFREYQDRFEELENMRVNESLRRSQK